MKNIILIAIMLVGLSAQSQQTRYSDLDIANALIGQPIKDIQRIADSLCITISYDGSKKLFVSSNGTTKYYKVIISDVYHQVSIGNRLGEPDCILNIFVRYTFNHHLHLAHFQEYETPTDTDFVSYEKKQGVNKGHLYLVYK